MTQKVNEPVIYDFIPDPLDNNFGHLPFPQEGDVIWIDDDLGHVVECSFNSLDGLKSEEDNEHTRYAELKIVIRI